MESYESWMRFDAFRMVLIEALNNQQPADESVPIPNMERCRGGAPLRQIKRPLEGATRQYKTYWIIIDQILIIITGICNICLAIEIHLHSSSIFPALICHQVS